MDQRKQKHKNSKFFPCTRPCIPLKQANCRYTVLTWSDTRPCILRFQAPVAYTDEIHARVFLRLEPCQTTRFLYTPVYSVSLPPSGLHGRYTHPCISYLQPQSHTRLRHTPVPSNRVCCLCFFFKF